MFKKKTRPSQARSKEDSPLVAPPPPPSAEEDVSPSTGAQPPNEDDEPNVGATIADLLALRRFREKGQGLDLEKLNRGEVKKRKKKVAAEEEEGSFDAEGGVEAGGLVQGKGRRDDDDDEVDPMDEGAKLKNKIVKSNFTGQTNALDVDKHMMAYIEAELLKRRGGAAAASAAGGGGDEVASKPYDPQEELYAIAEEYRIAQKSKPKGEDDDEGNVMNSMAMLTAIPEVDLGMDARLKNIEDTERAKRAMLESRKKAVPRTRAEDDFAAARFLHAPRSFQSDTEALENAQREAEGLPPLPSKARHNKPGGGQATDEAVMERFKKRMRK